jgi:hypothetical protein
MIVPGSTKNATRLVTTGTHIEFDFGKRYQLYPKRVPGIRYHPLRSKEISGNSVAINKTPCRTDTPNQKTKAHDFKN